jgi:hypothetical protein
MEERLRNPYFLGSRGWNGPIESWVGKNKVRLRVCVCARACLRACGFELEQQISYFWGGKNNDVCVCVRGVGES